MSKERVLVESCAWRSAASQGHCRGYEDVEYFPVMCGFEGTVCSSSGVVVDCALLLSRNGDLTDIATVLLPWAPHDPLLIAP